MLRLIVLLLLLANGAYYAWSQGLLLPWGSGPAQQAEPQRLTQQIQPEAIRVLRPDEAAKLETSSAAAVINVAECLQAGPLEDAPAGILRTALTSWPSGSWTLEPASEPARWIVYMGKYASAEQVERKKAELRQRGISFDALGSPALEPGLSLGSYATQPEAERQLEALSQRGVRTARVVQERAELRGQRLQLPVVDDALRPRLDDLKAALGGKPLRPCR